jgi:hypothetical protein
MDEGQVKWKSYEMALRFALRAFNSTSSQRDNAFYTLLFQG